MTEQELSPHQSGDEEELTAPGTTDTAPAPTTPYNAVLTFQGLVVQLFEEKQGQEGSVVNRQPPSLSLSLSVYFSFYQSFPVLSFVLNFFNSVSSFSLSVSLSLSLYIYLSLSLFLSALCDFTLSYHKEW